MALNWFVLEKTAFACVQIWRQKTQASSRDIVITYITPPPPNTHIQRRRCV